MMPDKVVMPCCGAEARFPDEIPGGECPDCDGFTDLFEGGLMSLSFHCDCPRCGQTVNLFLQGRMNCVLAKKGEEDTAMMKVLWKAMSE